MKRINSLIVICCILTFIGGLLSINAEAQQKSSNNQKKTGKNKQQMNTNQEQTIPPVRTPEELAYFQQLIEQALNSPNGLVRTIVGVRDFAAQDELLRQIAPFNVELVTKYEIVPFLTIDVNVPALIYMRDSELVKNIRPNRIGYLATEPSPRSPEELIYFRQLIKQAQISDIVRVIVGLNISFTPEGKLTPSQRDAQRTAIRLKQNSLLELLAQFQITVVTKYDIVPFLTLDVNTAALEFMQSSPVVANIRENQKGYLKLDQSVPLIGAPNAWNRGFSGAGQAIAVLDTGVEKSHIFLTNKIISEACYSTNAPNLNITSLCPSGATQSTAVNSGSNCAVSISGCDHGTHTAGIAAGNYPAINRFGVAKDSQIISIQVFSEDSSNNAVVYFTDDLNRGLQRVQALSGTYNIAAVNLSLGLPNTFTNVANCDSFDPLTTSTITTLRSYGIATIVASGNGGVTNALSHPACISSAISVGSTRDSSAATGPVDTVSNFSNSASFLNLLAPGELILSSVPGGGFANFQGTSEAAPHVAGAFAILKQRINTNPHNQILVDRILRVLQGTGKPILDSRNGITKPRIQIDAALLALVPPVFDYDGDDRTDVSVFRPGNGTWYLQQSQNGFSAVQFGLSTDVIVPGDYDGDGRTDVAVFRPSNNVWYIQRSRDGFYAAQFGQNGDKVAPGDYDADGRIEIAVLRPSTGDVYYQNVTTGAVGSVYLTNTVSTDEPVPGDYDGDGRTDAAVFDALNGVWYIRESQSNVLIQTQFGQSGDRTVQADYDADGKTDIALWRPSNATWYLLRSQDGFASIQFGLSTDLPVPGDYDGDRRADIATFRPSQGNWFIQRSALGFTNINFGLSGDRPTPNAYVR